MTEPVCIARSEDTGYKQLDEQMYAALMVYTTVCTKNDFGEFGASEPIKILTQYCPLGNLF